MVPRQSLRDRANAGVLLRAESCRTDVGGLQEALVVGVDEAPATATGIPDAIIELGRHQRAHSTSTGHACLGLPYTV